MSYKANLDSRVADKLWAMQGFAKINSSREVKKLLSHCESNSHTVHKLALTDPLLESVHPCAVRFPLVGYQLTSRPHKLCSVFNMAGYVSGRPCIIL